MNGKFPSKISTPISVFTIKVWEAMWPLNLCKSRVSPDFKLVCWIWKVNSFNLHLVLTFIFLIICGVEPFNFHFVGHLNTSFLEYLTHIGLYSYWKWKWSSCPTLCDPVDCSLPGSSLRVILHAKILKWVAISFSGGSSRPRYQTQVSRIAGRRFNLWATREAQKIYLQVRQLHS